MVLLKNILVTTDLSDYSLTAMEYATSFGLLYCSKLFLLHVVEDVPAVFPLRGVEGDAKEHQREKEERARHDLKDFIAKNISRDVTVIPIVVSGIPHEAIKRFAEEQRIDIIIMATHGRTGLQHIIVGSVAEKVVRTASVPVLTVKPPRLRDTIIRKEDIENELHLP
ncbi:MAG: universal stress protein [Ignavibacteriae bacterium]|nr:universal stress protein [Ignavibacteriota bacterium]